MTGTLSAFRFFATLLGALGVPAVWEAALAASQVALHPVRTVERAWSPGAERQAVISDSLKLLAKVYAALDDALTFGDTDHDGRNEVILAVNLNGDFTFRILEEQGNNIYTEEQVGPYMDPFAAGDLDSDGKSEIVGQAGRALVVFESPSAWTYPSQLSWRSPDLTNIVGYTAIGDTDRDGRMEIIHSVNTLGIGHLRIFENTGDNAFAEVFDHAVGPQDTGPKLIADLDGDGLTEIALCGTYGYLYVFESPADDVWQVTFVDSTGLDNAYAVTGGVDTDGNGKPELFVSGDSQEAPGTRVTVVYEASDDNRLERVDVLNVQDGYRGGLSSDVGDVDGVGRPEFVLQVRRELRIYGRAVPGEWRVRTKVSDPSPSHLLVRLHDVNGNGRAEVFWAATGNAVYSSTLVYEHAESPISLLFPLRQPPTIRSGLVARPVSPSRSASGRIGEGFRLPNSVAAFPNPCRDQAQLRISVPTEDAARLAIYDVAGRVVERRALIRGARGEIVWPVRHLPSGVYWLLVETSNGEALAAGRATIISE
jgi:type IX secretion system substrate protein